MYFAFSTADVPDETLIPAGWYPAHVVRSDLRDLKSGAGQRLVLTYVLTDGPYAGRKIEAGFNVDHPNPQAIEISQKELAKVLRACGLSAIQDTLELHHRAHHIRVGVEVYKDREQNRVTDWRSLPFAGLPTAASPAPAARPSASAAFQAPPAAPVAPFPASQAAPTGKIPATPTGKIPAAPVAPFPASQAAPAGEAFNDDIPW